MSDPQRDFGWLGEGFSSCWCEREPLPFLKTLYSLGIFHSSDDPAACVHGPSWPGRSLSKDIPYEVAGWGVMFRLPVCLITHKMPPFRFGGRKPGFNSGSEKSGVTCDISAQSRDRSGQVRTPQVPTVSHRAEHGEAMQGSSLLITLSP